MYEAALEQICNPFNSTSISKCCCMGAMPRQRICGIALYPLRQFLSATDNTKWNTQQIWPVRSLCGARTPLAQFEGYSLPASLQLGRFRRTRRRLLAACSNLMLRHS